MIQFADSLMRMTLLIHPGLVDILESHYQQKEIEYLYCVTGGFVNDSVVSLIGLSPMLEDSATADALSLVYDDYPCDKYSNVMGMMHPHLDDRGPQFCNMSQQDLITWRKTPFYMNFIQCGSRKWAIFENPNRPRIAIYKFVGTHPHYEIDMLVSLRNTPLGPPGMLQRMSR